MGSETLARSSGGEGPGRSISPVLRIGFKVWSGLWLVALLGFAAGCKKHVVLRVSAISLGRVQAVEWQCESGQSACREGGVVRESDWNQSGTEFLPLPECPGGVHQVLVQGSGPSTQAHVACQGADLVLSGTPPRSALLLQGASHGEAGTHACAPGEAECHRAAPPPVARSRTFPLPDCGDGGIGRILISEPYQHPKIRVACLDAKSTGECPGGAPPEPDLENGGFKCPERTSSETPAPTDLNLNDAPLPETQP
jgi:hypothetical protein